MLIKYVIIFKRLFVYVGVLKTEEKEYKISVAYKIFWQNKRLSHSQKISSRNMRPKQFPNQDFEQPIHQLVRC